MDGGNGSTKKELQTIVSVICGTGRRTEDRQGSRKGKARWGDAHMHYSVVSDRGYDAGSEEDGWR